MISHMPASLLCLWMMLGANPYLEEGRRQVDALEYRQALPTLELAAASPTLTVQERRETFQLLATCYAAIGRMEDVERAWLTLLASDPNAPDPVDVGPRLRNAFLAAKRHQYPEDFVQLERVSSP